MRSKLRMYLGVAISMDDNVVQVMRVGLQSTTNKRRIY